MSGFERVVVALGAPDGDASLIAYAVMLARLGRARELRFVHVTDAPSSAPALRDVMRARADEATRGLTVRVGCDVLQGSLTDRLLDYVTEFQADGAHRQQEAQAGRPARNGGAVFGGSRAGRAPRGVVARARGRGLLGRRGACARLESPALRPRGGAKCTALHVITQSRVDLFAGAEQEAEQAARDAPHPRLGRHPRRRGDVTAGGRVAGPPTWARSHPLSFAASIQGADIAHTILAEARAVGADLALSTRGRSRSASILLGSVAEKVIERSPLPLLVGKHRGRNLGLASILLGTTGAGVKTNWRPSPRCRCARRPNCACSSRPTVPRPARARGRRSRNSRARGTSRSRWSTCGRRTRRTRRRAQPSTPSCGSRSWPSRSPPAARRGRSGGGGGRSLQHGSSSTWRSCRVALAPASAGCGLVRSARA